MPILDKYPFKDDIFNKEMFDVVDDKGSVILKDIGIVDKTKYVQKGDVLGAKDLNILCEKVDDIDHRKINGVYVGSDIATAESKKLLIDPISQAQAITLTRANELDPRIPLKQINTGTTSTSPGMDVYLRDQILKMPTGMPLTYGGVVRLTRVDVLEIKHSFNYYYCEACTNTPTGVTGWLDVSYVTDLYAILVFTEVATKNVYKRNKVNGVWDDWKLTEGEVVLWQGSTSSGEITLNQSIDQFTNIVVLFGNNVLAHGENIIGAPYIMTMTSLANNESLTLSICGFTKKSDKKQLLLYSHGAQSKYFSTAGLTNATTSITKIYGRP